ncbi:hypothetical protein G6F22_018742 [Rhizopus arrhizus]|nr:hypothetical protein G6F22_018742 [Rhizopus arrhizus]
MLTAAQPARIPAIVRMAPILRCRARRASETVPSSLCAGAVAPGEAASRRACMGGEAGLPQGAVDSESEAGGGTGTAAGGADLRLASRLSGTRPGVVPPAFVRFSI